MHRKEISYGILTLLLMIAIFSFSSQDAAESGKMSSVVSEIICELGVDELVPEITDGGVEGDVRKLAHLTLYFCLGIFSSRFAFFFRQTKRTGKQNGKGFAAAGRTAAIFCFLYACSDEWHQTFVAGRSGQLSDVGIDSCGAVGGIVLSLALLWLFGYCLPQRKAKTSASGGGCPNT